MVGLFGGVVSSFGTFVDVIVVISLAVFMAIDSDKIMRAGLDLTPPEKRDDAMLFRRSVGSAAAGFIRSQIILGGLYGVWAFLVCLLFGIPFAPALAFLAGLIMAIPIYGPYVSWLPPVVVAAVVRPEVADHRRGRHARSAGSSTRTSSPRSSVPGRSSSIRSS